MKSLEFFRLQTREEVLAHYDRFAPVGVEEVELAEAGGRLSAAPILAPEDVPWDFCGPRWTATRYGPGRPSGPAPGLPIPGNQGRGARGRGPFPGVGRG